MRLFAGLSALAVSALLAQPALAGDTAPAPEQAQQPGIQDIIVTANKREENINKVGLSITAISAGELKERRVVSLSDLASSVPGLSFGLHRQHADLHSARRGLQRQLAGHLSRRQRLCRPGPAALPRDGQPCRLRLERVEVLKGPQGTLFGENATGGAINYIAAKPTKPCRPAATSAMAASTRSTPTPISAAP
jgi:outer membrane receptor protein involved in Fe transport